MFRYLSWGPTIALSCPWVIAFFYSFQVTLDNGWLGFIAFGIPIALNLLAFGWILGDKRRDPAAIFRSIQARYTGLFLSCQVLSISLAVFTGVAYLFIPLFGLKSIPIVAIFVLLAIAAGHSTSVHGLKVLHIGYLVAGLAAAAVVLVGLWRVTPAHPIVFARFDGRFYGLVLPTVVGFLLGPWSDVQHWQRAIAIHKEGGSIRRAYAWGALLIVVLISINAVIAVTTGPALTSTTADGLPSMQASVAGAVSKSGNGTLVSAYIVWAMVAVAATLDSFYFATRWLLQSATSSSNSPLLAFVPAGILTSPLWFLLTALLLALLMIKAHVAMIYLMMPFATLIAGSATCLVCETVSRRSIYDGTLCTMIGLAAYLMLVTGYVGNLPALMTLAPLVALIGALPAIQALLASRTRVAIPIASQGAPAPISTELALPVSSPVQALAVEPNEAVLGHGYDGQWYFMHLVPTYDDTNSVGNVYFANYFRWIGKTRELLFNSCMPEFDLRTTDFYVLTKSFEHDFRREIREFTPVTVRLKIGSYNRKFVTLVHEIHSRTDGLIGKGEQTIMFVDSTHYKPLDIPPVILRGFMPLFAQALRLNAGSRRAAS